jgi:hypothetical protein
VGNKAEVPIKFIQFQHAMAELGYDLISRDPKGPGVLFRANKVALDAGRPPVLTTNAPDFVDYDGVSPAYEKAYVVDLLSQLIDDNDPGGSRLLARRNFDT